MKVEIKMLGSQKKKKIEVRVLARLDLFFVWTAALKKIKAPSVSHHVSYSARPPHRIVMLERRARLAARLRLNWALNCDILREDFRDAFRVRKSVGLWWQSRN